MHQYTPIEVLETNLKGGSTKPWKVRAMREDGSLVDLAVKLFSVKDEEQYHPVSKEILGHGLAKSFGIQVPEFGLMKLTDEFLTTLDDQQLLRIHHSGTGAKFASEWLQNSLLVDLGHIDQSIYSDFELSLIYAYDHLIWNGDRKIEKPNI